MKGRVIVEHKDAEGNVRSVGMEIEDPHVWRLCCRRAYNQPPLFEPADDECQEYVDRSNEGRQARIDQLQAQIQDPPDQYLDNLDYLINLKTLGRSYGVYNGELDELIQTLKLTQNTVLLVKEDDSEDTSSDDEASDS